VFLLGASHTYVKQAVLLLRFLLEGAVSTEAALMSAQAHFDNGNSTQQQTAAALIDVLWSRLVRYTY
jgi:uncharacterized membrane protein (DUF4010 family)